MFITNVDSASLDIYNEFKNLKISTIREALRKGSLGYYGSTFKLNTQEICIWIRKTIYEKNNARF